jgi:hypothetical protein
MRKVRDVLRLKHTPWDELTTDQRGDGHRQDGGRGVRAPGRRDWHYLAAVLDLGMLGCMRRAFDPLDQAKGERLDLASSRRRTLRPTR